mgnify:CR=1 FL=1
MDYSFTTIGALIGMAVAIILIIKKVQPAYPESKRLFCT